MRLKILLAVILVIAALNSISVKADEEDPAPLVISKDVRRITRQTARICARVLKRAQAHYKEIQKREAAIQEDIKLLAEVIYHENWHTDKDHLAAYYTGAVVMNRVKSDKWPNTVHDVLYQSGQYSTTKKFFTVELPAECYELAEKIIREGTPDVPFDVVFQSTFIQGFGDWIDPINGEHFCFGRA